MGRRPSRPDAVPRLRARRKPSGVVHYYYDHGGKPRREEPLGPDYGLAIQKWADYERSRYAKEKLAEVITFRYVADRYRAVVMPTKSPATQACNARELKQLLDFFDDPPGPLDAIAPMHVRKYLTHRSSSPVRANREKALLSHLWNFARDAAYTNLANPCAGIKGNKEKARDVYVDDVTYLAFWTAADQPLRDAMDLAYLTGQRPSDVLRMQETDVRDGSLELTQAKTGAKLRIGVTGELADLLAKISERKRGHAVRAMRLIVDEDGRPLTAAKLRGRFDRVREATGLRFQFRDLRAKAASDKTDSSGDIRQAQRQLGHTSVVMTEAYVRSRRGAKVDPTK
jgi:integrase